MRAGAGKAGIDVISRPGADISALLADYLQDIDNAEIIETIHARRAPMIAVSASRRL